MGDLVEKNTITVIVAVGLITAFFSFRRDFDVAAAAVSGLVFYLWALLSLKQIIPRVGFLERMADMGKTIAAVFIGSFLFTSAAALFGFAPGAFIIAIAADVTPGPLVGLAIGALIAVWVANLVMPFVVRTLKLNIE